MAESRIYPLQFQLGEMVWLVCSQISYLAQPWVPPLKGAPTDEWLYRKIVCGERIEVTGAFLSNGKVYYKFPGEGNDDGRDMFRDREEAEAYAEALNRELEERGWKP